MILTKNVLIKVMGSQIEYYNSKGYKCKPKEMILVNIEDVSLGSHVIITAKCQVCDNNKELTYKTYNTQVSNGGYFVCSRKCRTIKNINTCLTKYGVEFVSQVDEFKERSKNTCKKKYGVEYVLQSKKVKNKSNKTNLKKYGVKLVSQADKFKQKSKETCKKKYGVEYFFQLESFKEKAKNTCVEKYGVEHYSKTEEFIKRSEETRIKNGTQYIDEFKNKFLIYSREVDKLTKLNKIELFNSWNGYDYYDSEYIKDNLSLDSNDKLYPTIDHKISIYYGFNNNISSEKIANIDNLCITKRLINSKKNKLNENEFISRL